ncbi:MAG: sulfite exporter TauE/SafE family protein [Planctomycetota bacterium]
MPTLDELTAAQVAMMLGALLLGSFVQGATGFAFGLLATPLLIWAGLSLPAAVAAVLTAVLAQTAAGSWRFRDAIVWRDLPTVMVTRNLGLPLGLIVMGWLSASGIETMKLGVGVVLLVVVLLVVVLLVVVLRPKPRAKVPGRWAVPAGLSSGFLSGVTGMGGPPVVIWAMAHDWSTRRSRAFLWTLFLQLMPVQLGLMWWRFGEEVGHAMLAGLVATPAVVLAAEWGSRWGSRWSPAGLRRVTLALLLGMALVSIVGPWLG